MLKTGVAFNRPGRRVQPDSAGADPARPIFAASLDDLGRKLQAMKIFTEWLERKKR